MTIRLREKKKTEDESCCTWVKVGHSRNETHRYSGVGCYQGVRLQIIILPVFAHCGTTRCGYYIIRLMLVFHFNEDRLDFSYWTT